MINKKNWLKNEKRVIITLSFIKQSSSWSKDSPTSTSSSFMKPSPLFWTVTRSKGIGSTSVQQNVLSSMFFFFLMKSPLLLFYIFCISFDIQYFRGYNLSLFTNIGFVCFLSSSLLYIVTPTFYIFTKC